MAGDQDTALAVLLLSGWLHRRVEKVMVLDDERVRRRVTVDFTVPDFALAVDLPYVPLAYLRKEPLIGFDLRNQSGHPIPMLTKAESGLLEARALQAIAPEGMSSESFTSFLQIAEAESASARELHDQLSLRDPWEPDAAFGVLLARFVNRFALLVPTAAGRQIVKYSYLEPLPTPRLHAPFEFAVEPSVAAMGGTVHLELEAPREFEIVEQEPPLTWRSRRVGRSVHFYMDEADSSVPRGTPPAAPVVLLAIPRRGLLRTGLVLALAVTVLLLFVGILLEVPTGAGGVSIMLAMPGLYGVVLARPDEHSLASHFLGHLRILVLCHLAIPLTVAAYVASVPPRSYDRAVMMGMTLLSAASTVGIVAARLRLRAIPGGASMINRITIRSAEGEGDAVEMDPEKLQAVLDRLHEKLDAASKRAARRKATAARPNRANAKRKPNRR